MTEQNPKASNESNPIGEELMVEVSIPEKIEIKMVDASSLNDFELWSLLASIFLQLFCRFFSCCDFKYRREASVFILVCYGYFPCI